MSAAETSLQRFSQAARMLAEADTIQKAKELKDLSITVADWAQRKGMGEEAVRHARSYALEAERRMGEMLAQIPKATGVRVCGSAPGRIGGNMVLPPIQPPTLSELGLTKRESSQAQRLAQFDPDDFESLKVGASRKKLDRARKQRDADARRAAAVKGVAIHDQIIHGDFRKAGSVIPDGSVDLIFTDPPYLRDTIGLYEDLALFASQKLVDGGSLIAYCGQVFVLEAARLLEKHLRYWWTCACIHSGRPGLMTEYGIKAGWKPMLWFVKGTRGNRGSWVDDTVSGGREKDFHPWQQAESEAAYYIEQLCPSDGFVVDPFLGGGTTAAAAQSLGRRWIGIEIDETNARHASTRMVELGRVA